MQRRFSNVIVTETDISPTIEAGAGEGGNNLPMILDALVFDEGQITCPTLGLHPKWGGISTTLAESTANRMTVIIKEIGGENNSAQPSLLEEGKKDNDTSSKQSKSSNGL